MYVLARIRPLALLLILCQAGCSTVPRPTSSGEANGPPGRSSYLAGRASQSFQAPLPEVVAALNNSMRDLEIGSLESMMDGTALTVSGKTKDRRDVLAVVRSHRGSRQVAIRVGWYGDEALSRELLKRLAVRLGDHPPEAIPAEAPSTPGRNPFFSRQAVSDEEMLRDFAEAPYRDRVLP